MKLVICLIAAILVQGCIHPLGMTHQQACARQGMVVKNIFVGDLESAECKPPETEQQICEIKAHQESTILRSESNSRCCGFQNTLVGVGYVFYILPGAILYYAFNGMQSSVVQESNELDRELVAKCETKTAH